MSAGEMPLQTSRKPKYNTTMDSNVKGVLPPHLENKGLIPWVWVFSCTVRNPGTSVLFICVPILMVLTAPPIRLRFQPAGREWGHRQQPHPPLVSISSWPGLGYKEAGKCSPCSALPCGQSEVPYREGNPFGGTTSNVHIRIGAVGLSHTSYCNHHPSGLLRESKDYNNHHDSNYFVTMFQSRDAVFFSLGPWYLGQLLAQERSPVSIYWIIRLKINIPQQR